MTSVKVKRALISVFDKTGLDVIAESLKEFNVTVLSTGGTAKKLRELGVDVVDVQDVTKYPEMLGKSRIRLNFYAKESYFLTGGRVKTLHPAIHGGLLANRKDDGHLAELKQHDIEPIDLVISNLYPFQEVRPSSSAWSNDSLQFMPSWSSGAEWLMYRPPFRR